ncbi:hypothetical protein K457DRAFT_1763526, partial [Linnemannia elongata AG-77]
YTELYTPDPSDRNATLQLLDSLLATSLLSPLDKEKMTVRITETELEAIIAKTPLSRAPGQDGLSFELYRHILKTPWIRHLLVDILNDALLESTFPQSWQHTVMILLYKKGEASHLSNWRPLSLINCDAKVFTKLI